MHEPSQRPLPHTRLLAHQRAQDLACASRRLAADLPRGQSDLRDQLVRSSHSVARNIAEGANRWAPADKLNRFSIAQGELGECDSCLETIERMGWCDADAVQCLRQTAAEVGRLVGGLMRRQRRRLLE